MIRRLLSSTLLARFWARVNKNGPTMPHMESPCWLWTGGTRAGYGRFSVTAGVLLSAHRLAYELTVTLIPLGLKACHRCDNRLCMRPDHIFPGTQLENILDSARKGRHKNPSLWGEQNPMAKLTLAQVQELRANPPRHDDRPRVAQELGISHRALRRVLSGERWGPLDDAPIVTHPKRVGGDE